MLKIAGIERLESSKINKYYRTNMKLIVRISLFETNRIRLFFFSLQKITSPTLYQFTPSLLELGYQTKINSTNRTEQ